MSSDQNMIEIDSKQVDISDLKVTELKTELKKRGLSTTGVKQELFEKLKNYLIQQNGQAAVETENEAQLKSPIKSPRKRAGLRNGNHNDSVNETLNESVKEEEEKVKAESVADITQSLPPPQQPEIEEPEPSVVEEENTKTIEQVPEVEIKSQENEKTEEPVVEKEAETEEKEPEVVVEEPEMAVEETEEKVEEKSREPSRERSESLIKEVPLSGDRNRFSRSKSPKARWCQEDEIKAEEKEAEAVVAKKEEKGESEKEEMSETSDESKPATETIAPGKTQRKRKWLSEDTLSAKKSSMTISSDTLKSYLPTNPLDNLDKEPIKEEPEQEEEEEKKGRS